VSNGLIADSEAPLTQQTRGRRRSQSILNLMAPGEWDLNF
jgi:hypothetical protein